MKYVDVEYLLQCLDRLAIATNWDAVERDRASPREQRPLAEVRVVGHRSGERADGRRIPGHEGRASRVDEILRLSFEDLVDELQPSPSLRVVPIHSSLDMESQLAAFEPAPAGEAAAEAAPPVEPEAVPAAEEEPTP